MNAATRTYRTFAAMSEDDAWLGYGYLGERRNFQYTDDGECLAWMNLTPRAAEVARVDAAVIDWATGHHWTDADLFAWANSKTGRHFADTVFGGAEADIDRAKAWGLLAKVAR